VKRVAVRSNDPSSHSDANAQGGEYRTDHAAPSWTELAWTGVALAPGDRATDKQHRPARHEPRPASLRGGVVQLWPGRRLVDV